MWFINLSRNVHVLGVSLSEPNINALNTSGVGMHDIECMYVFLEQQYHVVKNLKSHMYFSAVSPPCSQCIMFSK